MPLTDIEVGLGDTERAIRDGAHKFAEEIMRPAGVTLDRLQDPGQVIAAASPLWEVFERYRALGLGDVDEVSTNLEPVEAARLRCLVNEELGWGDSGLAISLGVAGFHRMFAKLSGRPALLERFCAENSREIGCWAVTEPDHGSDTLAVTEPCFSSPTLKANCVARRDGEDWVIRGQKAAWVSNGCIADVAGLFCATDEGKGLSTGGVCLVPLDLPGVTRGAPLDKLGQRPLNQGEIFFDDVRIPSEYMVIGPDLYAVAVEQVLTMANAAMGSIFVGLARGAFELALGYAHERIQGGRPIFEHQSVRARLFRMFTQVEAARSLSRRVMIYNATSAPLLHYSIASKVFCTQTAFDVASAALQIFGGNGLTREYPIEKLLRDARASMIEDGCNELLSLVGAAKL